jgi:Xaa-Pro aminopeptidase
VPTAPEVIRNRDAHHLYRFDSYFWYLTGFPEPEAVVVLIGGKKPKSILFCREKHEEREIWDGYRYGPKAAKAPSASTPPTRSSNSTRNWPNSSSTATRCGTPSATTPNGTPASPRR